MPGGTSRPDSFESMISAGPPAAAGCVLAHEVLDNFPVHVLEVAGGGDVREVYVDIEGSRLVERLGPLSDGALSEPALVAREVVSALGVREQFGESALDLLAVHVATRRMLLVLDNCEHLIEECARFVEVLLKSCPGVRVLATSRQSLGVAGESVMVVPPLQVPAVQVTPL